MKLVVAAVGRLKAGPMQVLAQDYAEAATNFGRKVGIGPVVSYEIGESRAQHVQQRRVEEGRKLLDGLHAQDRRVVLVETGSGLSSTEFATWLGRERDAGVARLAFIIGGPDGHDPMVMESAAARQLSLGPMTLPHGLARIVLLEQLFRAATLLSGHPYHRA